MSFFDQPPSPLHFMPMPFAGGGAGGVWPNSPMNHDIFESYCQFEHAPSFKRMTDSNSNLPNSATFPAIKSRMNSPNLQESKGTSHIFYKTRMCAMFLKETFKNGENCTFAHGVEDLRNPPPNWQDLICVKDRELNEDQEKLHRMKICKIFYDGEECPYGYKCKFLHERPSKINTNMARDREISAICIKTTRNISDPSMIETSRHENDIVRIEIPIYCKTKICIKWETTGQCPFHDRCHFAHGKSELQEPMLTNFVPTTPSPFSVSLGSNTMVNASVKEEKGGKNPEVETIEEDR
ncbi:zinc finger CCCH domain-containing protein 39-like [Solanum tuberosum]|nr:PREDICTED: zinc finger CCCH domain-containing protein 39-like [Solanum tuberosum]